MILHQWDIVRIRIRADDKEEHPAVILSREEWCQDCNRRVGSRRILAGRKSPFLRWIFFRYSKERCLLPWVVFLPLVTEMAG